MNEKLSITNNNIENLIFEIRGVKVMLDYDLATLYEVEVAQLKRQVRRNIERFPGDFMFELTAEEAYALRCHFGILKTGRGKHSEKASPQNPIGFKLGN